MTINNKSETNNFYFIFIILTLTSQSIAVISGKYAAISINDFCIYSILLNPYYILSLSCLVIQAIFWQIALRKFDLFFSYMLMSLVYIVILIASYFLFKEEISIFNIIGSIVIIFGVILITLQKKEN